MLRTASALTLALIVAACSGASPSPSGTSQGSPAASSPPSALASALLSPQPPESPNIVIEYPGQQISAIYVDLMLDRGLLTAEGLTAETVVMTPADAMRAQIAGDVEFTVFGASTAINARLQGNDITIVAGANEGFPYRIYGGAGIDSVEALRGKAIAIGTAGDVTDLLLTKVLEDAGLARTDVNIIPTGSGAARLTALVSGSVQGSVLVLSDFAAADAANMQVVADEVQINALVEGWPFNTWNVSDDWAASNPNTIKAFLRAFLAATDYIYANPDEVVEYAVTKYKITPEVAGAQFDFLLGMKNWSMSGEVDLAGVEAMIEYGSNVGAFPKDLTADQRSGSAYVDLSFLP